jgi:hypothetical protein
MDEINHREYKPDLEPGSERQEHFEIFGQRLKVEGKCQKNKIPQ